MNDFLKDISESFFKDIFEFNPYPMWIYDIESLRFLAVNQTAINNYGYSKDEFLKLSLKDIRPDEDVADLQAFIKGNLTNYQTSYYWRHKRKDGTVFFVDIHSQALPSDKYPSARLVIAVDVSNRKFAEDAIADSELKFRTLAESTNAAIFLYEAPNFIYVNSATCKLTGYTRDELLQKKFWEVVHPDDQQMIMDRGLARLSGKEVTTNYQFRILSRSGQTKWIDFTAGLIPYKDRSVSVGTAYDITDQKLNSQKLQISEKRYRDMADLMPQVVFEVDLQGKLLYINKIAYQFFHFPQDGNLSNVNIFDFVIQEDRPRAAQNIRSILSGKSTARNEYTMLRYDNTIFPAAIYSSPIYNDGNLIGLRGIILDISVERENTEMLKNSNDFYLSLFENFPALIFRTNQLGDFNYFNSTFISFAHSEFKTDEANSFYLLLHPEDTELYSSWFDHVFRSRTTIETQVRIKHRSGSFRWLKITGSPYFNIDKSFGGCIFAGFDITENIDALNTIKESEEKYSSLFENTKSIMLIVDPESSNIIDANSTAADYYGYSVQQLKSKSISDISKYSDEDPFSAMQKALNFQANYFIRKHILASGELRDVEVYSSPININGRTFLFSIIHDITDRVVAQQYLQLLFKAINQSPVSILITDKEGKIDFVNNKFTDVSGYSSSEALGKTPSFLNSGLNPPGLFPDMWNTIKSGNEWRGEILNKKKDGSLFWESAYISPVTDEKNIITHFVAVKEDITQQKFIQQELLTAKQRAEAANKLKSNFLANMSHELRTPLIGILGFAELLLDKLKDAEDTKMVETIFNSGRRLMDTLNSILDISKIESDKYDLKLVPTKFVPILIEAFELNQSVAASKKLKYSINYSDADLIVDADTKVLFTICNNLINNAVKYTNSGFIDVSCSTVSQNNIDYLQLIVADSGIGIKEELLPVIFEPFRQASEGYARKFEGSGLGLTLIRNYVDLLKGFVSVRSIINAGSAFTVLLPLSANPSESNSESLRSDSITSSKSAGRKLTILSVEDEATNRSIIQIFLKSLGIVDFAPDADSAVLLSQQKKYDVILLDINLQGKSGLEALKEIRQINGYDKTPVIAVSAYAMQKDINAFLSAGCTHYLSKPFTKRQILDVIIKAVNGN
jgi:PAS domain S-box-containing protein